MQKFYLLIIYLTFLSFAEDPFSDPSFTHINNLSNVAGWDYSAGGSEIHDYSGKVRYIPPPETPIYSSPKTYEDLPHVKKVNHFEDHFCVNPLDSEGYFCGIPPSKSALTSPAIYSPTDNTEDIISSAGVEDTTQGTISELQPYTDLSTLFKDDSTSPFNYMSIANAEYFKGSGESLKYLICTGFSRYGKGLINRPLWEFFAKPDELEATDVSQLSDQ
jgi:hypothetical protein